jgi:Zn-dependent protease
MLAAGGINLFRVRGIRISVDYSWFLVLFLIIWWLSEYYRDVTGAANDAIGPYLLALASALLFFGSILLHELGHALVAIRNGIGIEGITLWMFGGVARMERDSDSPATEFRIAVAGPLVTAAIVVASVAVGIAAEGPAGFRDAALVDTGADVAPGPALISWLASINVLVLLFNLIPAFPLDGGRIARSIAWWRTGDRTRATRFAAALGQGFGLLMILAGLGYFMVYRGALLAGIWLALIGFVLRSSARGAVAQTEVTRRIEGVSVADVMDREPVAMAEGLSIERALDEYFLRYQWAWFPVVDAGHRFVGLLDRGTADAIPAVERASSTVGEILAKDEGALAISEDAPLETVLGRQALRGLGALIAVDSEGRLRGVLTADAVGRALR